MTSPTTPRHDASFDLREHITDMRQLAEEMAMTAEGVPGMNLALSKARIARVCRAFLALAPQSETAAPEVDYVKLGAGIVLDPVPDDKKGDDVLMQIAHIAMGFENEDPATHYQMLADIRDVLSNTPQSAVAPMTASDFRLMSESEKYGCYASAMRRIAQSATLRISDLMSRALADTAEMLEEFAQLEKEGPRPGSGCRSRGIEVAVYDYCDAGAEQVRSFVFTDGEAEALVALIRATTDRRNDV